MVDAFPRSIPLQIPPLENGDRLNRYEFERRMPHCDFVKQLAKEF
ncbi:MAG: hypothetical protein AAGA83_17765 [Cyanobacteria bacterium P01_F01_bin.116]